MMKLYFGPNFRYFFDDGNGNFKYRAPPNFVDLFRRVRMSSIEHVAFGVGDSFFISYKQADGKHMYHFQHDNHYQPLKSWLFDEGLSHANAYVSLGVDDAFFAASSQGHRWRNIPEDALDYYQKFTRQDLFITKRVNTIDLGHNNTFLGIGIDNTWFWDLGKEYPNFEALNLPLHIAKATFVMISPFAPDQHFMVYEDGSVHYSLPPEWASDVAQTMQEYAVSKIKQRPSTHFWQRPTVSASSSTQYSPYQQQQQQQQQQSSGSFDVNEGMHLANNVLDMYNNTTNAGGQSGGSSFDVNQALNTMQNSIQTINNVSGYGSQGLDMVNQLTNTGVMVGQLGGQLAGVAGACVVM